MKVYIYETRNDAGLVRDYSSCSSGRPRTSHMHTRGACRLGPPLASESQEYSVISRERPPTAFAAGVAGGEPEGAEPYFIPSRRRLSTTRAQVKKMATASTSLGIATAQVPVERLVRTGSGRGLDNRQNVAAVRGKACGGKIAAPSPKQSST